MPYGEVKNAGPVPRMPDYMHGVINLLGHAVPVVDIKKKFGMSATERTIDTCIIIVEVNIGGDPVVIGVLADSVLEVFDLDIGHIEPAPKIGTHLDTRFLWGMGRLGDEFILRPGIRGRGT